MPVVIIARVLGAVTAAALMDTQARALVGMIVVTAVVGVGVWGGEGKGVVQGDEVTAADR